MTKPTADIAERYAPDQERAAAPTKPRRWRAQPLLPEAGAGGAPLTAVIAVISFLAALALAGFLMISAAAGAWTNALQSTVTIQIKGADNAAIDASAEAVARILDTTDGVADYEITPPSEAAKLLEPWLGKGDISAYLNVPALIEVHADETLLRNLDGLRVRLEAAAPQAALDDHSAWRDQLTAAAQSGRFLALMVLALIIGATMAIAIFAARAGLAANQNVVSLLHLVGASDAFIAGEVQRRFVLLALRGSFAGLAAAGCVLGLARAAAQTTAAQTYFLPGFDLSTGLFAMLVSVPIGISFVMATTARLTVLRTLRSTY